MRNNKIVLFAAITGCIFGAFSMASRLEKKNTNCTRDE